MTPTETDHPKHSRDPLSLLLPVRDAAGTLASAIDGWRQALDKLGRTYEILVIDDGSTDGTHEAANAIAARQPSVRVVRHDSRRGVGACLRTGIGATTHPNVAYAGPGYDPWELKKLVEMLDQAELASGYRTGPAPGWLRSLSRAYRGVVRVVFGVGLEPRATWHGWGDWRRATRLRWQFGVRLSDPSCDFKAIRRSVLERIAIQSDGEFVHAEIVAKANFLGCLMAEVPVSPPKRSVEPPANGDYDRERRRVFRNPEFVPPAVSTPEPASPVAG